MANVIYTTDFGSPDAQNAAPDTYGVVTAAAPVGSLLWGITFSARTSNGPYSNTSAIYFSGGGFSAFTHPNNTSPTLAFASDDSIFGFNAGDIQVSFGLSNYPLFTGNYKNYGDGQTVHGNSGRLTLQFAHTFDPFDGCKPNSMLTISTGVYFAEFFNGGGGGKSGTSAGFNNFYGLQIGSPTCNLASDKNSVPPNTKCTLTWNSTNSNRGSITGGGLNYNLPTRNLPTKGAPNVVQTYGNSTGSIDVYPIVTTTYILTTVGDRYTTNADGTQTQNASVSATSSVTITVVPVVRGCTNPGSFNYNPNANVDDGSCVAKVYGCIDKKATNYNPNANTDDGSCTYAPPPPVRGCTDPKATNYNPNATQDDGSCTYAPPPPVVTPWLSADRSATGQAARASTGANKNLLLSLAADHAAQNWVDTPATFAAGRPCLRYDRRSADHQIRVSYEAGGGVETRTSGTEGRDWTMPTTITAAGKFPAFCVTPTGTQHHFWVSGGAVMRCILDPQGHVLMGAATVAPGAADDALAAWHNADTGDIYLEYRQGNAIVTLRSTDSGKTYV